MKKSPILNNRNKWMAIGVAALLLASCDTNKIYETHLRIPDDGWKQNDIKRFNVYVADTASACNIYINVRNNNQYKSMELWLFVTVGSPSGKRQRDTVSIRIADEYGKWIGNGLGSHFDTRLLFQKDIRFPETGIFTFEYEQGMRDEPLIGVEDIGLRIEKSESSSLADEEMQNK
ncbi:MAG: gliding motility lipoprotein GldH [Bacteroidales bacterium]|jgi:gliding motility-associated lipoprotein GldH|nr:gliding motility lipoprotein GldH [Bacteroidales bacterium]